MMGHHLNTRMDNLSGQPCTANLASSKSAQAKRGRIWNSPLSKIGWSKCSANQLSGNASGDRPADRNTANDRSAKAWKPGPLGAQNYLGFSAYVGNAAYHGESVLRWLAGPLSSFFSRQQPKQNHYLRQLDWVKNGLWNTDPGVTNREFIERLYSLIGHPDGGWRTGFLATKSYDEYTDVE